MKDFKFKDPRIEHLDEFDKKMCEKHPDIFQCRFKPMSETCMCWGFAINEGWFEIIEKLCIQLQLLMDKFNVDIVAEQVKEKFGGLRFYTTIKAKEDSQLTAEESHILWDIVGSVIGRAEDKSVQTCEKCGEYRKIRTDYAWHVCLCDKHDAEKKESILLKVVKK